MITQTIQYTAGLKGKGLETDIYTTDKGVGVLVTDELQLLLRNR